MSIPARGEIVESENPLDVLSRAATMVEKSEISPRLSPPLIEQKSNSKGGCERSSSFKERTHPKFRKSSTPDYMVALESARSLKRQTSLQSEPPTPTSERMDTSSPNNNTPMAPEDVPLDMSIKKRPSTSPPPPPQYRFNPLRQHSPPPAISSMNPSPPSYRHPAYKSPPPYPATPSPPGSLPPPPSYEESTVKCTYPTKNTPPPAILQEVEQKTKIKEITIITNSSADPLLDEHFRRSLGANYESLFKKKSSSSTASDSESSSTESTPPKVPQMPPKNQDSPKDSSPKTNDTNNKGDNNDKATSDDNDSKDDATQVADPVKAFREDMEMEGFSVDDHFAKALGDTWIKLQKAEEEKRSKKSEDNTKPTVMASS